MSSDTWNLQELNKAGILKLAEEDHQVKINFIARLRIGFKYYSNPSIYHFSQLVGNLRNIH